MQPGTITGRGIGNPRKTPWTRELMENGWECTKCRWKVVGETTACPKCSGPMTRMYPMVEYDPPTDLPVTVNGIRYFLKGNQTNTVPNIVRDIARQFFRETADPLRPRQPGDPVGVRKLETVGFLPPVEEDKSY